MRITLDLDEFKFATTTAYWLQDKPSIRWLVVNIDGRPFSVHRMMYAWEHHGDSVQWNEAVDHHLVEQMEVMLAKILKEKTGAIPAGTNIPL